MSIFKIKTIKGRVSFLVLFMLVNFVVYSSYIIYQNYKIRDYFKIYSHVNEPSLSLHLLLKERLALSFSTVVRFSINKDQTERKYFKEYIDASLRLNNLLYSKFDSINVHRFDSLKLFVEANIHEYDSKVQAYFDIPLKANKGENVDTLLQAELDKNINPVFWTSFSKLTKPQQLYTLYKEGVSLGFKSTVDNTFMVSILLSVFSLLVSLLLWNIVNNQLKHTFKSIIEAIKKLSTGEIVKVHFKNKDEVGEVMEATNILSDNIEKASTFAYEIGKGQFESDYHPAGEKDVLGKSLVAMRNELKKFKEDDEIRNWTNQGYAKFAEIIREYTNSSLSDMTNYFISQLVRYININQGGIFVHEKNELGESKLVLYACYAYERKKFVDKTIEPGEGLVGAVFLEKESMYITDIPSNYIHITSGLGGATPKCLLIVPLKLNEEVYGVIELAAFKPLEKYKIEFVEKIAETLASAIGTLKISENTKKLLQISQQQTEHLQNQEEEMRQNLEELQATQEELARRQKEADLVKERMEKREMELLKELEMLRNAKSVSSN